jgi:hypothetical protein
MFKIISSIVAIATLALLNGCATKAESGCCAPGAKTGAASQCCAS